HAKVADRMGDPTPRLHGRLTLEPWAHLDPLGTILLILYRFGWAKPVPINPRNFREPRKGILYTSLAGPASNFVVALAAAVLLTFRFPHWPLVRSIPYLYEILAYVFLLNVYFGVFNLIPIPPLDGSRVLAALLPARQAYAFSRIEPYGPFILVAFLVSGLGDAVLGAGAGVVVALIRDLALLLAALFGIGA
ncbi:MAG: site-2 protease family protein, partial [Firmicutes bacterium]|nr:site-2 protease family protein [Bacillota bacterium]